MSDREECELRRKLLGRLLVRTEETMRLQTELSSVPADVLALAEELVAHARSWRQLLDLAYALWPRLQVSMGEGVAAFFPDRSQREEGFVVDLGETCELLDVGGKSAIKCLLCGRTSYSLNDVRHRYCGFCHMFHKEPKGLGR